MTGPQQDPTAGGPVQPMPPAGAQPPVQPRPGYPAAGAPGAPTPPPGYPAGAQPLRPAYGPPQPGSAYQPGARPQPNFPGNFGPQGYPPPGYGPSPYSYPPPRQRRTGLLIGIIIAAVVLIGGGVTLLIVLLNKGGGGSAQEVADTYLEGIQASDKSVVYDISCQANQQYMDTNAAAIDAQLTNLATMTVTMQPVQESGSTASAQIDLSVGGQTSSTSITLYKNDNDTWLVCDAPLSSADQDR